MILEFKKSPNKITAVNPALASCFQSLAFVGRVTEFPRSVKNMPQRFQPIETPLGFVNGRDGIYLDDIELSERTNRVTLNGAFNSALCSKADSPSTDFAGCRISFSGVLAFKVIELDSWDGNSESSFDEVLDSDWVRALGGKVTPSHRHFLVQTYDDVVEVVCESADVTLSSTELGVGLKGLQP